MSRSALWRQEDNVKERESQAEELFQLAVEEGRNNRAKNLVPMWGPDDSFHFNPMLLKNIINSSYFQKCCRDITDWNTLVDEIYYQVKHLEPWAAGSSRDPSTAFCLLLRLLTLRCTEKQMKLLLEHVDSPYIRAIGFLFLRYAGDPKVVWQWIEPYLYDEEPTSVEASASKQQSDAENNTVGDFVRRLFKERNYYGTVLPRLPIQIERDIQVKLLQAEKIEERAKKHTLNSQNTDYFKKLGNKIMALYGDEENPIQWYEAVVDRVISTNEDTAQPLRNPKFVVTFPEYGNTETVTLGEMEMPGSHIDAPLTNEPCRGGFSSDRAGGYDRGSGDNWRGGDRGSGSRRYDDRGHGRNDGNGNRGYNRSNDRGYNDHRDKNYHSRRDQENGRDYGGRWQRGVRPVAALPSEDDLYEEVRRRERETVTSGSRNAISRRPPSTKTSLLSNSGDTPRRSASPQTRPSHREKSPPPADRAVPQKKRTAEELAAIQQKKRRLMAKYG